jgi:hypothetical protein
LGEGRWNFVLLVIEIFYLLCVLGVK